MTRNRLTNPGTPLPLGVTPSCGGINFAVYTDSIIPVKLHVFRPLSEEKHNPIILERTGKVHHICVENVELPFLYTFEIEKGRFLLDPYATATNATNEWGAAGDYSPLGVVVPHQPYDWEGDIAPNIPRNKLIIYEMHIRGFTRDSSSKVLHPGTYKGVTERIRHLKELGVNAVELLPLFEFNEQEYSGINPTTQTPLCNYWGYSTACFFSPMNRYASKKDLGCAQKELKDLIKELHRHGIEVILDVVYNHTAEGNEAGPVFSFKGFDNATYYLLDEQGRYLNFSGCGNTFNSNEPIVRELILASLRYWAVEYHIDGFRFDLASALTRGSRGAPLFNPPLIDAISKDPILANVKLIAEAWDAAGLYHVGNFYPQADRWSEWNGLYRDAVRRFIKGTPGTKGEFATRLCGSRDLYHAKSPSASLNFITSHDGFTLADLVSYNQKHNKANGENNQDGTGWNDSWNCGQEGETDDPDITALRNRQMRNFHVALMVSQGIPMLHMGDEYGHTKRGNNNTWCQDNRLNWFLWDQLETNRGFFVFFKRLIAFRASHPHFSHPHFLADSEIEWHGISPGRPSWDAENNFIAFTLFDGVSCVYVAFNASEGEVDVTLPPLEENFQWELVVNTGNAPPNDFYSEAIPVETPSLKLIGFSSLILEASSGLLSRRD